MTQVPFVSYFREGNF